MEQQLIDRAMRRGLLAPEALLRARAAMQPGESLLAVLVRSGVLRVEAVRALQEELEPSESRRSSERLIRPPTNPARPPTNPPRPATNPPRQPTSSSERFVQSPQDSRPSQRIRAAMLGQWELLAELGRGSNGIVYRARRAEHPAEVALKVLPDAIRAGEEVRIRFHQEATLARRLDHPAIVRVLDAGESGPHAWYAMELCKGETLYQRLRRGPLPPAEAAALVARLARAITHAHERAVIHRDLKPANVILVPGQGPRITDFGLARDAARDRSLTRTGEALGTPLYMAPEQLEGKKDLDGRVDVWALGVILFECVAGRRPFDAPDTLTLADKVLKDLAPPLRSVAPSAPEPLEAVCKRALARGREERWQATELAEALERFALDAAAGGPADARLRRDLPGARRDPRPIPVDQVRLRRRTVLLLGAAVVLAAAGGLGIGLVAVRASRVARAEEALSALAMARPGDEDALQRARAAAQGEPELTERLHALERSRAGEAALRRLAARAGEGADPAELQALLAAARDAAGPAATPAFQEAVEREGRFLAALRAMEEAALRGDAGAAAREVAGAQALADQDPARMRPLEAARRRAVEKSLSSLASESALELERLRERARAAEQLAGSDAALARRCRLAPARWLLRRGRHREALDQARPIVPVAPQRAADEAAAEALHVAARAVLEGDLPEDPRPALRRLLEEGPEPWRGLGQAELGLLEARTLADLEQAAAQAARIAEAHPALAAAHELLGRVLLRLGTVLARHGDPGAARSRLTEADRALDRAREAAPDDCHPPFHQCLVKFHLQRYEEKVEVLSVAIRLSEPRPHFRSLFWRGHTLHLLGKHEQALADFRRCLDERPRDLEAATWLGVCTACQGRVTEAREGWVRLARERPEEVDRLLRGQGTTVEVDPFLRGLLDGLASGAKPEPSAPADHEALERAWGLFRRGQLAESRREALALAERPGRVGPEARLVEAVTHLWEGDSPAAAALLDRLAAEDRGPVGLIAWSLASNQAGRIMLAQVAAEAARRLDPEWSEADVVLAGCLVELGQHEPASRLLARALERHPDHPCALVAQAAALRQAGRLEDARAVVQRLVGLCDPPLLPALTLRIRFALLAREADAALADADRLVERWPARAEGHWFRALALALLDRTDEARAALRSAAAADPRLVEQELAAIDPALRARLGLR